MRILFIQNRPTYVKIAVYTHFALRSDRPTLKWVDTSNLRRASISAGRCTPVHEQGKRSATPHIEAGSSFYSTAPTPKRLSTSVNFTEMIFETPFSCIVTPKRVSAWFIVGFLCVITMNCVSV